MPYQVLVQQVALDTAIQNNITAPIDQLQDFPAGFAEVLQTQLENDIAAFQAILGSADDLSAAETAPLKTDPTPGPTTATPYY